MDTALKSKTNTHIKIEKKKNMFCSLYFVCTDEMKLLENCEIFFRNFTVSTRDCLKNLKQIW